MRKVIYQLVFIIVIFLFFWKFFLQGLLPIPADTIVGMYHPWRDFYAQDYPNGIPFKNFLITDPVRQQYPWRKLSIDLLKQGKWPLWNPYTFVGTPLLANFQSAAFYPLNILFFILPFNLAWSVLIILQPILAGLFLFLYLRHFKLKVEACFLGALSFAFSGFFIAWLEWNTILHVGLWLPLILLAIEKILCWFNSYASSKLNFRAQARKLATQSRQAQSSKPQLKTKNLILWSVVFLFSLISSFLAGHLQTFFYVLLVSLIYAAVRILSLLNKERWKVFLLFTIYYLLFTILTSVQWLPTLKFISLSARGVDQTDWQKEGWFVPWQHLVQFFAPDFFGNPSTLNYWGTWNYGELVGYLGILPLIMAVLSIIWRKDKKTLFFGTIFFLSLIFALPTPLAKLPYQLKIPFLSTSQPTRLLFLTDFSLSVLVALGFDHWLRKSPIAQTVKLLVTFFVVFVGLWAFVLLGSRWLDTQEWLINLAVAKRNLILPTGIFITTIILLLISMLIRKKQFFNYYKRFALFKKCKSLLNYSITQFPITIFLLILVVFDLFRFGWKFTPFTKKEYLFPKTKTIDFLQEQPGPFRIIATDRRILPPNFSIVYQLQTIDGYDPLYLRRFGELITASERGESNISPPFGFNRIITPQNFESRIIDLLNVKYVLSLKDEDSSKLVKVFQEGETHVYENKNVFPRAFMVYNYKIARDKQEAIEFLMDNSLDLSEIAILEKDPGVELSSDGKGKVTITDYGEQHVRIEVETDKEGLLVLSDNFYPGWQAMVDNTEESMKTFRVNFTFRGIVVPEGEHKVDFYPSL